MDFTKLPITKLDLSTRAKNQLQRNQFFTAADLLTLDEQRLMAIPKLGSKTIQEILAEIERLKALPDLPEAPEAEAEAPQIEAPDWEQWIQEDPSREFLAAFLDTHGKTLSALDSLSPKAYNLLTIRKYDLAKTLLAEKDELMAIPWMDEKTADEIGRAARSFLRQEKDAILEARGQTAKKKVPAVPLSKRLFLPQNQEAVLRFLKTHDVPVEMLGLSNRAQNQLRRNGLAKLSDVFFLTREQLLAFPNMGALSAENVLSAVDRFIQENESNLERVLAGENIAADIQASDETVQASILALYQDAPFTGLSFSDFRSGIFGEVADDTLKQNIGRLIAAGKLEYVDYRCYRVYPRFADCFDLCPKLADRNKDILRERLFSSKLEEIGEKYNLTRERIRQICSSAYTKVQKWNAKETGIEHFDEDYFRPLYTEYDLAQADAEKWLGMPKYVFRYFESIGLKKGQIALSEALNDDRLTPSMRFRIRSYLNRNKLHLDGVWVDKKRNALEQYVVQKYCRDTVTFEEFVDIYNRFLKEEEVPEDLDLYITPEVQRTRLNILSGSHFLLWTQGARLRFYDIDGQDLTELYEMIGLDSYENVEYSTAKLFQEFPEAMQKFDIRDHYELHNLLRKALPDNAFHDLKFGKSPMIRFGEFDRGSALLDLLIANAPISQNDFAKVIEAEYGYDPTVTIANYLTPLNTYYHKGIYRIDHKQMLSEHRNILLSQLTEDFYYLDELRQIYKKAVPDADPEEINSYNLKSMGFQIFSRYVLRNHDTLEAYFRRLLTADDIVDITPYRKRFTYVQAFSGVLTQMKRDLEIVEMAPGLVIRQRKLLEGGITLENIREYCNAVYDWTQGSDYFSIQSIKGEGFASELFDYGFDDWFYANLLLSDLRLCNVRCFNNLIFCRNGKQTSVQSFLVWKVRRTGIIDVYDLQTELTNMYGCSVEDRQKLIYQVQGTGIYYDRHLDRLYANEDLYYQELDAVEGI